MYSSLTWDSICYSLMFCWKTSLPCASGYKIIKNMLLRKTNEEKSFLQRKSFLIEGMVSYIGPQSWTLLKPGINEGMKYEDGFPIQTT